MNIIEKKMNALKAFEQLDKKLNEGLNPITRACENFIKENPLNGSKSENAIIKQYHKKVEKIIASLPKVIESTNEKDIEKRSEQ